MAPVVPVVFAFYYLWYGTPERNGDWMQWAHRVLPHWRPEVTARHPTVGQRYEPPESIGAAYWPKEGPYSVHEPLVLEKQAQWLAYAGVSAVAVSWHGVSGASGESIRTNDLFVSWAEAFSKKAQGVQVVMHLEPYEGRSVESIRRDLEHLVARVGSAEWLYRDENRHGKPWFFVFDSYHLAGEEWARLLSPTGDMTVRGTRLDGVFIGLILDSGNSARDQHLITGHFDGAYNYFSSAGFTHASTPANWQAISQWCSQHRLIFVPSVGPGYNDTSIRPWNEGSTKSRRDGAYYEEQWKVVRQLQDLAAVSITSFNEWGEGTQIEPADCSKAGYATYTQAGGCDENLYLTLTKQGVEGLSIAHTEL
ncbi:hypothetical protein DIPPA_70089 [Diplonema papillatum]|nr:hypothetical protein DIPPA_70089 [Diplonema papillatum]